MATLLRHTLGIQASLAYRGLVLVNRVGRNDTCDLGGEVIKRIQLPLTYPDLRSRALGKLQAVLWGGPHDEELRVPSYRQSAPTCQPGG